MDVWHNIPKNKHARNFEIILKYVIIYIWDIKKMTIWLIFIQGAKRYHYFSDLLKKLKNFSFLRFSKRV